MDLRKITSEAQIQQKAPRDSQERHKAHANHSSPDFWAEKSYSWNALGPPRAAPNAAKSTKIGARSEFVKFFERHFLHHISHGYFINFSSMFDLATPLKTCSRSSESTIFTKSTFSRRSLNFIVNRSPKPFVLGAKIYQNRKKSQKNVFVHVTSLHFTPLRFFSRFFRVSKTFS